MAHPLSFSRGLVYPGLVCRLDALELLEEIKDDTAGMVVVDPPAELGVGTTDDLTTVDEQIQALKLVAEQATRVLRPGGVTVSMGPAPVMAAWDVAAARAGLSFLGELAVMWDRPAIHRPHAVANKPSLYMVVRRWVKPGWRGTFNASSMIQVQSNVLVCRQPPHLDVSSQRPVELFNYLVTTFTEHDDLVVDPLCGSGSSLVAAELSGRQWLGSDVRLEMCRLARKRIDQYEVEDLGLIGYWYDGKVVEWI